MKEFHKNKYVLYSIQGCKSFIWMANVAKLPVNKFAWRKDTSQFNENFIKNYNEESGD